MLTRPGASLRQISAAAAAEGAPGAVELVELAQLSGGVSLGQVSASWEGGEAGSEAPAAAGDGPGATAGGAAAVEQTAAGSEDAGTAAAAAAEAPAGSWVSAGAVWLPSAAALATAVYNCHYRPYLRKQRAEIAELKRDEALLIPLDLDYSGLQVG